MTPEQQLEKLVATLLAEIKACENLLAMQDDKRQKGQKVDGTLIAQYYFTLRAYENILRWIKETAPH